MSQTQLWVKLEILIDHLELVSNITGGVIKLLSTYLAVLSQDGVQLRLHSQSLLVSPGNSRGTVNSGGTNQNQREGEGEEHLVSRSTLFSQLHCSTTIFIFIT